MNLIKDPWLPAMRQSGPALIRISDVTDSVDRVISLSWPRADLRTSCLELLIGVLSTITPPVSRAGWRDWWHAPPPPAELDRLLAPFAAAFELDGDGARFLQVPIIADPDADDLPVEQLLLSSAAGEAVKRNTDLLSRRGYVGSLGRPAAAIALYTLQSWAPKGGRGHLTGLRGGAPLVTLIRPCERPSLWQLLWANVQSGSAADVDDPAVFPWLGPISPGEIVTPQTAHPLQVWWSMPRQMRLEFTDMPSPIGCELTGYPDTVHVRSWQRQPLGHRYRGWTHPLSPRRQIKTTDGQAWVALKPRSPHLGYEHWLGVVVGSQDGSQLPAATVATWREGGRGLDLNLPDVRLICAGYQTADASATAFVTSEYPLLGSANPVALDRVARLAEDLVHATDIVSGLTRLAVRNALFSRGAPVALGATMLAGVRDRVWDLTEPDFYAALRRSLVADDATERTAWLRILRTTALQLFDLAAPLPDDPGTGAAARIISARKSLVFALLGYSLGGPMFSALGLIPPQQKRKVAA